MNCGQKHYHSHVHVPAHFQLDEPRIRTVLSGVQFGDLVTVHEDGPRATPVPFYLDEDKGCLVTHLVKVNPQVTIPSIGPALVILNRDDAYVSPLWYATNDEVANVPTWDYITVHVTGRFRIDTRPEAALDAATCLTERMESTGVLGPVGKEKLARMARAIVRAEVDLDRVEGKAKASQNRHPDDVTSVIAHLEDEGGAACPGELVTYMREAALPYARERFGKIQRLRGLRRIQGS